MGLFILFLFIICSIYVQTRGTLRHDQIRRRITDHANLFAPLNCLFYTFSRVPTTPYVDPALFPELKPLQDNWKTIRDEAQSLNDQGAIKASDDLDDIGFNSFFKTGWTRFYLKWYGSSLGSAKELCPVTTQMVEQIPSIKGAMFTALPPGARLVRHRDPFAGSLRYHMGLSTPNDDQCFIDVDGTKYSWRDGEVVMFDETYIHHAENETDANRIVLFLDIKRPVWFAPINWINTVFSNVVMAASATKNRPGDKVGAVNRAFAGIYKIRAVGKRIKQWNKSVYYLIQYGMYAGLIYLIFF
ncbi:aspartyl/asparaginyl beta-hydroxylase domain-containing protein [Ruegeria sp.]|uniref:aspartyl/asparaginyl beta-hydroxylase domain-containing protein n=1 Tax=Ruegeria sp. TaxID=1879320 RepID=UPI00230DF7D9|nr:aspartyl/asparaginyl beta-hydroxylase domain-containing protein [Ruegeria sp.]MDA7966879.1 aspartyl/asparaginyl beta-hydroxylase domain-containing protein [Ruegeria sp.]